MKVPPGIAAVGAAPTCCSSVGSARARGSIADSATVPLARYSASWSSAARTAWATSSGRTASSSRTRVCAYGREVPWRGPTASPSKVSYWPVSSSSAFSAVASARHATSGAAVDLLEADRMTVMLSRPPASLAAAISSRPVRSSSVIRSITGRTPTSWIIEVKPSEQSR